MFNKVPSGGRLKVEHVVGLLEKRYPYVELSSILGPDSAYDKNRKVSWLPSPLTLTLSLYPTLGVWISF